MPRGLRRFQQSGHSHFVTFSCYRRLPYFEAIETFDLFLECLEEMRRRFEMCRVPHICRVLADVGFRPRYC